MIKAFVLIVVDPAKTIDVFTKLSDRKSVV